MKKMILTALVAVASITANAQIWVGGNVGLDFTRYRVTPSADATTVTHFAILPEVGYTLSDKWDLAIKVGDEYSKRTDDDAMNVFVVNPYARYTFFTTGKVGFFVDLGFSIKTGDMYVEGNNSNYTDMVKYSVFGAKEDETQFGVGVRPGIKYAASDKVTLVASIGGLGFSRYTKSNVNNFGFNADGNALQFGCYYSF